MTAGQYGAAWSLLLTLIGCTNFPEIPADVCGNAVIEPGEDCDSFANAPYSCRPPGIVGECHYDCRLNADGTRATCPGGSGCAADGICRTPNGSFEPPVKLSSDISSWVSTADFDGDLKLDLISAEPADQLQQARFRLHYFDADNELVETRTFPRVTTRPIARQLNDDVAADLIFSNDLIGMVPGRADREWVPATFSSYVLPGSRLRAVAVRDGGVGGALGLVVFSALDGGPGVYVPSADSGKLALRAKLSRPFQDLAGPPIAVELFPGHASPCAEVVYAFLGEGGFHVLDMCEVGTDVHGFEVDWRPAAREQFVRLLDGVTVDAPPVAADVDGDGNLDILIGSGGGTYVAHGDGTKLESEATRFQLPLLDDDEPYPIPMPLAAGDLTGDGLADFVLPLGILASHESLIDGKIGYFVSFTNIAQPWTMATVTDLNGNDLPDVIAGADGAPGLSFLNGTGGPYQIAARVSTQGPLRFLTTGDFDGDLIGDVAFVQSGPPQDPKESLGVAFGQRDGVVLAGNRIAELSGVQQLGSAAQGSIDSLFVSSTDDVNGVPTSTFTLFDGNPDRLPFAPYSLVTFASNGSLEDSRARALVAGGFTAPHAHDLVAIGGQNTGYDWTLWLVPDIGGGKQPPQLLAVDAVPHGATPLTVEKQGGRLSVAGVAADLDRDLFDEAVLLMPVSHADPAHPDAEHDPDTCVLLSYDIDSHAIPPTAHGSSIAFDEPCASPELYAEDVNHDGFVDLLLLIGDSALAPRRLEILFNDKTGHFPEDQRRFVAVGQHDVRSVGFFGTGSKRLVLLTDDALYIANSTRDAMDLDELTRIGSFHDAHSVVVTDPNGDGIEDIAVADAAGLWLVEAQLR